MRRENLFGILLCSAAAGAVISSPARAQEAEPASPAQSAPIQAASASSPDQNAGDIVVTGSRIKQANMESVSPVTQVGAVEINERGATRVEDFLNRLPQVQASYGSSFGLRGETGTSTVDLRGLGTARTLVLINGRRLPYGSPKVVAADLNLIPNPLIKNVEVLTGGASAVYGSDALAGVVNFVLDDKFQGVRFSAEVSAFQHHNGNDTIRSMVSGLENAVPGRFTLADKDVVDGLTQTYSVVVGGDVGDGRGNVTAYGTYRKINPVAAEDRDSAVCTLGATADGKAFTCNPSPVGFPASFVNTGAANLIPQFRVSNGEFVPRNAKIDGYTVVHGGQYQRPDERYMFGATGHYEISEHLIPYFEMGYTHSFTRGLANPGAVQRNGISPTSGGFNCDNPFFSAQQQQFLCTSRGLSTGSVYDPITGAYVRPESVATGVVLNRRTPENGLRDEQVTLASYRIVAGLMGAIDKAFSYDFAGSFARVDQARVLRGLPSQPRASTALFAVVDRRITPNGTPVDPNTFGKPVCAINADASAYNDDPKCGALDYFSTNGPSPASVAYVDSVKTAVGNATQTDLILSVQGDLGAYGVQSPWAEHGVAVAFGGEYRRNSIDSQPDKEYQDFNEDYPISGKSEVTEFFGEVSVPLIERKPFFELLSVEGAYRYSHYKGGINTDTYKLGLNWAPVEGVRLRGSYQRAVRAPNLIELNAAQLRQQSVQLPVNPNGSFDPCSGPTPYATFEQCARTGVTADQYGKITDFNFFGWLVGGNPNLKPEVGKTYTIGAVLAPRIIPRLTASIDYYNIEIDNLVGTVPPVLSLTQCLQTGDPYFCGLIHRGQGGTLHATEDAYFINTNVNTGSLMTSGIDAKVNYSLPVGAGYVDFAFNGTYVQHFTTKPLPTSTKDQTYDCAGYYTFLCGSPHPKWRHWFTVGWSPSETWSLTGTWRYVGGVSISRASSQPALKGTYNEIDASLGARNYFDLSARWRAASNFSLRAGVNNVFDTTPPLTSQTNSNDFSGGSLNTYPAYYDSMGRYVFFGIQLDL